MWWDMPISTNCPLPFLIVSDHNHPSISSYSTLNSCRACMTPILGYSMVLPCNRTFWGGYNSLLHYCTATPSLISLQSPLCLYSLLSCYRTGSYALEVLGGNKTHCTTVTCPNNDFATVGSMCPWRGGDVRGTLKFQYSDSATHATLCDSCDSVWSST